MGRRSSSDGKELERLAGLIEEGLRRGAPGTVTVNEQLLDRETGRPRQVDIVARTPAGHDEIVTMIEVRDHARKVDVEYIERTVHKRNAVGADVACVVSKSGFTEGARLKARACGIRLLRLDEVPTADWSAWCRARTIEILNPRHDNPILLLLERGTDAVISVDVSGCAEDFDAKLVMDELGVPILSLPDVARAVYAAVGPHLSEQVPHDGTVVRRDVWFPVAESARRFVMDDNGAKVEVGSVWMQADYWFERTSHPVRLMRYERINGTGSGSAVIAEVMRATVEIAGQPYAVEFFAETDGSGIAPGAGLGVRMTAVGQPPIEPSDPRSEVVEPKA